MSSNLRAISVGSKTQTQVTRLKKLSIGTRGTSQTSSPDLNPFDYSIWGYVEKDTCVTTPPKYQTSQGLYRATLGQHV